MRGSGECPERQRVRTVNPLADAFVGSSPTSPTILKYQENLSIWPVRFRPFSCRTCCIIFPNNFNGCQTLPAAPCNMNATCSRFFAPQFGSCLTLGWRPRQSSLDAIYFRQHGRECSLDLRPLALYGLVHLLLPITALHFRPRNLARASRSIARSIARRTKSARVSPGCQLVNVFGPKMHSQPCGHTAPFCPVPSNWVAKW